MSSHHWNQRLVTAWKGARVVDARFHAVVAEGKRTVVGRLTPGADLIRGLEEVCDTFGIRFAAILFAYGSLSSAHFKVLRRPEGQERAVLTDLVLDSRVEFLAGQGLICRGDDGGRETHLHGSVADESGVVRGGHFIAGSNPIYNNLDFTLLELLGVDLVRRWDPKTETIEMVVLPANAESTSDAEVQARNNDRVLEEE